MGVAEWHAWTLSLSGKGLWRLSGAPQLHQAMDLVWLQRAGIV